MSERDTFGARLRSARARRGISIATIAVVTKVRPELWEGLERNDVSRWPSGVFARSLIRHYARVVRLDETDLVNEFCRNFSIGDRRSLRLLEGQARLIGHELTVTGEPGGLPPEGERRAGAAPLLPRDSRPPWALASAFRSVLMRRLRPSR